MERYNMWFLTVVVLVCLAQYGSTGECGHTCSPEDDTLDCWRENIDYYSDIILEALNQRAIVANHIGEWKRKRGLPIVDLSRISAVLDRIAGRNPGPLPNSAIIKVFGAVVNETAIYEENFSGKPAKYECQLTSVQSSPRSMSMSTTDGSQLHLLLVVVLAVQILLIVILFLSVFCIMQKLRSVRR